jgi:hypothetical protein
LNIIIHILKGFVPCFLVSATGRRTMVRPSPLPLTLMLCELKAQNDRFFLTQKPYNSNYSPSRYESKLLKKLGFPEQSN